MPALTDMGIDYPPKAIDHAQRTMLGKRVPWIEREVLAEEVLLRCIKVLLRNMDRRHFHKGRVRFFPFRPWNFRRSSMEFVAEAEIACMPVCSTTCVVEPGAKNPDEGPKGTRRAASGTTGWDQRTVSQKI